jgi:branched-chain amino acid transport system ATP-binding protein
MLKVEKLNVNYGAFEVLLDLHLSVEKGEIVALLGGNGAGKTTTINTISGMIFPKSGTVEFLGEDISHLAAYKRPEKGITQVPEGRKLFPKMTVMDNLLVGSYLPKCRSARKENLELCFELFPKLYERRQQLAGSMSGGEQQMCAIARGMMQAPKLLMLDEPSLGLAPVIVEDVFEVIQKINKQGVTILLVEQNVQASLEIADRAYVIETGQNSLEGRAEDLIVNPMVKKAYLGL